MSYDYQTERPNVFKEEYQADFLKVRDNAKRLFEVAGAARLDKLISGLTRSSWTMLAFVDRLVELGEIRCISNDDTASQYRVYVRN